MKSLSFSNILILCGLLFIGGCEIINPEEPIPAFLHIKPFELNLEPNQGSTSNRLLFAEVLAGQNNFGIHTVPATIPVLETGPMTLDIFAGIEDNGVQSAPNIYNVMGRYQVDVDLVAGRTDTIYPVLSYNPAVVLPIVEDFEGLDQEFRNDLDQDPFTKVSITDQNPFEGNRSGKITVNMEHPNADIGSDFYNDLPPGGTAAYVELDYRGEATFGIGGFYNTNAGPGSSFVNFVNPKENWNKIYLNLSETFAFLNEVPGFLDYQIGIRVQAPIEDGAFVPGDHSVWIDNLKLIHF